LPLVLQHAHLVDTPKHVAHPANVAQAALDDHTGSLVGRDGGLIEIEDVQLHAVKTKFLKGDPQRLAQQFGAKTLAAVLRVYQHPRHAGAAVAAVNARQLDVANRGAGLVEGGKQARGGRIADGSQQVALKLARVQRISKEAAGPLVKKLRRGGLGKEPVEIGMLEAPEVKRGEDKEVRGGR
jgi:hypothetical protein